MRPLEWPATGGPATAHELHVGAAPRWFWLLPLAALLLWWPIDSYWQSDDFLALHYAQHFGNVLDDFTGPQYGATDVWLFYRPLITLSFWLDLQLGGVHPFVAHFSNVLAHAISTLLLGLLLRRFLPTPRAFVAALLWAALPSHVGSLAWAVGRVDSHTTVWCIGALLAFVRQCERTARGERAPRWPALLLTALALASKELAFVVPPLAIVLGAMRATGANVRARLGLALRAALPLLLLFVLYLGWRWLLLGRVGGYLAGQLEPWSMLRGLGQHVANIVCPWRWMPWSAGAWTWLAAAPVLAAVLWNALTHRRVLLGAAVSFAVAAVPMAQFFAAWDNVHNLRYFYLPSMALAALLAARSATLGTLILATMCWPLFAVRHSQREADLQTASMHRALLREAADGAASPMFVAGLPHQNSSRTTVQLHFGIDRLLQPPFTDHHKKVYALRPLAEVDGAFRLPEDDGVPLALPTGSTWFFADATALGRAPSTAPLPPLHVTGDRDGAVDFTSPQLLELTFEKVRMQLSTSPGVPQAFRLTLFTANGYLACLLPNHGTADAEHGTIDARMLLAGGAGIEPARYAPFGPAFLGEALPVPTTIDLDTDFPVLLEAGEMQGLQFVPKLRARRLLTFRFDRGYTAWMRLVQGKS